jgi:hypothetical protein
MEGKRPRISVGGPGESLERQRIARDNDALRKKVKQDSDNLELAKSAWSNADATVIKSRELAVQFGQNAIRAPGVLNAATIAALLGLVSANAKLLKGAQGEARLALFWLLIGALSSAVAVGAAYLSQSLFTHEDNNHTKSVDHPYVERRSPLGVLTGANAQAATVILVMLSYICFVYGAFKLLEIVGRIVSAA